MIRFLRFAVPYPSFIDQVYRQRSGLASASFADQNVALRNPLFPGATDSIEVSLQPYGYDTRLYHLNAAAAQRAWAAENGLEIVRRGGWMLEVAREQVLKFRPHVVFVDPYAVPISWIRDLRANCPTIRVVMFRYSSPRESLAPFAECDLIISGDRFQVDELKSLGLNCRLLHHAFDRRVLDRLPQRTSERHELLFSGQMIQREGFHNHRARLLKEIIESGVPVSLFLLSPDLDPRLRYKTALRRRLFKTTNAFVKRVPATARLPVVKKVAAVAPPRSLDRVIRNHAGPPLFGLELYAEMAAAKICLNVHGDVSHSEANNVRLWEATGVGSCLLTDHKENLRHLFSIGREVVTYDSPADCLEKTRWLLARPVERRAIAEEGQRRVLATHTFEHRASELDELIREAMS